MPVAHSLLQGHYDFPCIVRISDDKTAFLNALPDDLAQQLRSLSGNRLSHSESHHGIAIGIPDTPNSDHFSLALHSQTVQRFKEALEFFAGAQLRVIDELSERLPRLFLDLLDEGF